MKGRVGQLVGTIEASKTAEIQAISKKLQEEGKTVNSALCIGEPDYDPPSQVVEAVGEAAKAGHTRYTVVQGSLDLRKALCTYLESKKGVKYTPDELCVSNGGKQSIYQAFMAVLDPGDVVLVPTPCWVSYNDITRLCRAEPVAVETTAAGGYMLTPEALEAALRATGPKCKILVLCNPNNPTGAVLPPAALEALAAVLRKPEYEHVFILADELYEQLVFDTQHVNFASLPGMRDRTLLVGGFAKGWAMTGFRLGYLAAPQLVASEVVKLQSQITSCACSISQRAGLAALQDVPAQWFADRVQELRVKRDFVLGKLREVPGITCATPEGAFYAFPDLSGCLGPGAKVASGDEFCKVLLQDYNVALVPGGAFQAPMAVRISYAASMKNLEDAMTAFVACVAAVRAP
mmetsp:Transcript_62630/g.135992  ORF Transcript_62630/g.135992 Transcript_62630/m.135992 type:complete len:405 (+) Transcript_62630:79-1293(+)|eukprot:CAMPEP_0170618720 /NCGR_PEP_ID=MMETSP0224-20130122/27109_1 /TAXON_ID=285029 /ORGANISM="Togula jolla, Strain CCCM 725" /LENGTH=404 /DNA_ID=CAMNT_0010944713 /DNA_START=77 /DNA_END=1291 /DNA_ORIENTATION=+